MRAFIVLLVGLFVMPTLSWGQNICQLSGVVVDENAAPLPGASVLVVGMEIGTTTDLQGNFILPGVPKGKRMVQVSYLGYQKYSDTISVCPNVAIRVVLQAEMKTLQEVVVTDNYAEQRKKEESLNIEVVGDDFLKQNLGGSLMNSLERLPGVSSMDIGSGQSKPVIRGLGFNRVVVVENGVKHEGQQWGVDHGLEIDQYATERVEVIKGPASLKYGSDAIGGLVKVTQLHIPEKNSIGGTVDVTAKSNNQFVGSSVKLYTRKERLFLTTRFTVLDYGDFYVPSEHIHLYDWKVLLDNGKVRNTAGNEFNFHGTVGYVGEKVTSRLMISRLNTKSGFFANASGLKPLNADMELHDRANRDILYPRQNVTHVKLLALNVFRMNGYVVETELGYQNNFRQEWLNYSPHYGQPNTFPDSLNFPSDLEKEFDKNILSANLRLSWKSGERFSWQAGVTFQHQNNKINGRGFLVPTFKQYSQGAFMYGKWLASEKSTLNVGIRYDYNKLDSEQHSDWYYPFTRRAKELDKDYSSVSWSAGYNYVSRLMVLKFNVGKSFRVPLAQELAANGFNRHMFRYEFGSPDLTAEESYQIDMGLEYNLKKFAAGISPFVSYFPGYIFLNPSYHQEGSEIEGATLQPFFYTQSEVFRWGGEFHSHYDVLKRLELGIIAEYIYSVQLSGEKEGFTLPFSPPTVFTFKASYKIWDKGAFKAGRLSLDYKLGLSQKDIVPPEKETPGYNVFTLSMTTGLALRNTEIQLNFQIQNLFNTKYYDHSSYYRMIDMPEPGRNIILNINVPFNYQLKGISNK